MHLVLNLVPASIGLRHWLLPPYRDTSDSVLFRVTGPIQTTPLVFIANCSLLHFTTPLHLTRYYRNGAQVVDTWTPQGHWASVLWALVMYWIKKYRMLDMFKMN